MTPKEANNDLAQDLSGKVNDAAAQANSPAATCRHKFLHCVVQYEFLILITVAILLARAYPPLGATYLAPQITASWIALCFIFLLAGLGLKTEELYKAFMNIGFNALVQIFNFGFVSAVVFGISRGLLKGKILSQSLADGMVCAACVPMTINMVQVLTKSSGGDEAAALFNSAFGNLLGVFLSPVLILGYLGVTDELDIYEVFYELTLRVVVPVIVGQLLRKFSKATVDFVKKHKTKLKKTQELLLVFIVYTVFCRTFEEKTDSSIADIFLMIAFQLIFLIMFMLISWQLLSVTFPNRPRLRVMGLFGCTHKTVAMGIPLINAIYGDNPAVGLYTLPLLIWHPMQLILGSLLAPRLEAFVEREYERLGITDDEDEDDPIVRINDEANIHVTAESLTEEVGNDVVCDLNITATSIGVGKIDD